jgi:uncharacterized protein with FMN-binding domain
MNQDNQALRIIIVIAVLAALAGGAILLMPRENNAKQATASPSVSVSPAASASASPAAASPEAVAPAASATPGAVAAASDYKNGSYSATGSYNSPGGTEHISVTLTLQNDAVSSVSVTTQPASPTSKEYQAKFTGGFKGLVVGKDIDTIALSRVSGSSLTSQGFNRALEQIKQQAKG